MPFDVGGEECRGRRPQITSGEAQRVKFGAIGGESSSAGAGTVEVVNRVDGED